MKMALTATWKNSEIAINNNRLDKSGVGMRETEKDTSSNGKAAELLNVTVLKV
jgi:hypothetical protein